MRIAVVGAGIVGVTTAYELAADGHEVTVYDRCNSVAAESSFANAGLIAPALATPWATPGMRAWMLRQGFSAGVPWRWVLRGWRACRPETYARHRRAMFELTQLSQQRLRELRQQLGLHYERTEGVLVLLRTARDQAGIRRNVDMLREFGLPVRELSAEHCRALEPDLSPHEPLQAALQLPEDETGNCRQVAHLLRDAAENRHNAKFRFGTEITQIDLRSQRPRLHLHRLNTATFSEEDFDAVVACAGVGSSALLRPLGLRLPLLPVYGYSATFALRIKELGPRAAIVDEHHKVSITRQGPRVRVAGGAELGGDPRKMHQGTLETLYKVLQDWFPGAAQLDVPQLWKGAQPTLPDGPPVLGASGKPNLWLNLGHGSSGWALACGGARLLADQIAQRSTALDMGPFSIKRYTS